MNLPSLQRLPNGHYKLLSDWVVVVGDEIFLLEKKYTTNGITAPNWVKELLGDKVTDKETWCAVFHDWLFKHTDRSDKECDDLFIKLMVQFNVPTWKRIAMGVSVKIYSFLKHIKK